MGNCGLWYLQNLVYTIDILVADFLNGDLDAIHLLSSRQLWFILVVNPDGYARNEKQQVWKHGEIGQRKNTRPGCSNSLDTGVDLNRNYDVCFAVDNIGSNPDVCAEDYRGPHPFSEPETEAVRRFVERPGRDISAALNYHSYGRYFNVPFACESSGVPVGTNGSTFGALAGEMTRYNKFQYGQPWKDSNLYTVNGETSDWMWQAHGIFAMSPEVGPDFSVPNDVGFWPPREQVPALSAELHYSNVHLARVSGPMYALEVASVAVAGDAIRASLTISNGGLRTGVSSVDMFGSLSLNGSGSSTRVSIPATAFGSSLDSISLDHTLEIPIAGEALQELPAVYVVLRDSLGCLIFRICKLLSLNSWDWEMRC